MARDGRFGKGRRGVLRKTMTKTEQLEKKKASDQQQK